MRLRLCVCGGVVDEHASRSCSKCGRGKRRPKQTTTQAGYGFDWQQLSERYRREHPLCVQCEKQGIVTAADEVHHIVPITEAPWLRLEVSNLMALCVQCHRQMDRERRSSTPAR